MLVGILANHSTGEKTAVENVEAKTSALTVQEKYVAENAWTRVSAA